MKSFSDEAITLMYELLLAEGLEVRLFVNNHKPDYADNVDHYVEATGYGYKRIQLPRLRLIIDGRDLTLKEPVKFRFTGPLGRIFGYYLVSDGVFLRGKLFDKVYVAENDGDELEVTFKIKGMT